MSNYRVNLPARRPLAANISRLQSRAAGYPDR